MNERDFKYFINSDLVNFMELHKLEKIEVVDGFGNKAKITKDKNKVLNVITTIKTTM